MKLKSLIWVSVGVLLLCLCVSGVSADCSGVSLDTGYQVSPSRNGVASFEVTFSYPPTFPPTNSWEWDFGDGSPHSYERNPVHTYNAPGIYSVTFIARDTDCGKSLTINGILITVTGPVHNLNSGLNFTTIQAAINDSSTLDGHIIEVDSGSYKENIIVNKSLTIRSSTNDPMSTGIEANNSALPAIKITANFVNISGFNITGTTGNSNSGIYTSGNNCTISNNQVFGNDLGLLIYGNSHTITDNSIISNITKNGLGGIHLGSVNSTVKNNSINVTGSNVGIWVDDGYDNNIINNTITSDQEGIQVSALRGNRISDNHLIGRNGIYQGTNWGILLYNQAYDNIIENNSVQNYQTGFFLYAYSDKVINNTIYNNTVTNCNQGLLSQSHDPTNSVLNNTIKNNYIVNNTVSIRIDTYTVNNKIFNNYFNSTNAPSFTNPGSNIWNTTKTSGTNIVGGSYLGGNFWANSSGKGISQTCTDSTLDGICDSTYTISPGNIDYLPLTRSITPVANFTANVTYGSSPLSVQFTDTSDQTPTKTPTSWNWSFGDGNFSMLQNPSYTYAFAGIYTVSLNATNDAGSSTVVRTNYINTVPRPFVDFSSNVISGSAPLQVSFTDLSLKSPSGWAWYFGDENFTKPWTIVEGSARWSARQYFSSVAMPDGSTVLMGGQQDSGSMNDVWRSTDNGSTWTQMTASAGWTARLW
jgi:parallel beta-helix repeat protein